MLNDRNKKLGMKNINRNVLMSPSKLWMYFPPMVVGVEKENFCLTETIKSWWPRVGKINCRKTFHVSSWPTNTEVGWVLLCNIWKNETTQNRPSLHGWAEFVYVTFEKKKKVKSESWPPNTWVGRILSGNIWKLGSAIRHD